MPMLPSLAVCRLVLAVPVVGEPVPGDLVAVIPGLAPSLIAVLPQLILLLLGTFALVLSPRSWWRLSVSALRHPLRSAAVLLLASGAAFGAVQLAVHLPRPRPGPAIPDTVEGFPVGDLRAARCLPDAIGPVTVPETLSAPVLDLPSGRVERLAGLDGLVVLVLDRTEIACVDAALAKTLWKRKLDLPLRAGPLGFGRPTGSGERTDGLVVVTSAGDAAAGGTLSVLDAKDGSVSGRLDLPARPTALAALVDDRALLALEGSVASCFLSGPGAPRLGWQAPRPPREAVGLAGDPGGRFFLLDRECLQAGDLRDGALRELARFEPGSPARLAVRDGRAYVLTVDARGARVHCLDPLPGGIEWSVAVERPLGDEIAIASFGMVLTLPGGLLVLDPLTGERRAMLPVDQPPSCPAAVGDSSTYLLLAGNRLLRYSPGLGRADWSVDLPAPAALAGPDSLALVGDRLVVGSAGAWRVISERKAAASLPWSHFRGGADRAGTCDGERMPLAAKVLWRRPAGKDASVLPLPEGWLICAPAGAQSRFSWLDDGGALLGEIAALGSVAGAVRIQNRIFAAVHLESGEGAVLCLEAERQPGRTSLREIWRRPVPPLSEGRPLAAAADLVVVSLRASILALSPGDGRRRWESSALAGARTPLAAGGRVFAAGSAERGAGEVLAALSAADGAVLWKVGEPGWSWGPPTLSADTLLAPASRGGRGRLVSFHPADGKVLKDLPLAGEPAAGPLAAAGAQWCYAGSSGGVFLIRPGAKEPTALSGPSPANGGPPPLVPILGYDLLVVTAGPALRCVDASTLDAVWAVDLPAPAAEAALERGRIVAVAGGEVVCLGAE